MKMKISINYGFTLAEVLITLGIIGIVAAMTMPALIQKHRRQVAETRLKKFYSVMNQAITLSEVDNGDVKYWDTQPKGFETDNDGNSDLTKPKIEPWFNKYLRPYLKEVKVEYSKASEGRVAVYFNDGSLVMISDPTWLFFINANDYKEKFYEELESMSFSRPGGTKMFTFSFTPALKPALRAYADWVVTNETTLKNDSLQGCYKGSAKEHAYCSTLIKRNGWTIPKDYPHKF